MHRQRLLSLDGGDDGHSSMADARHGDASDVMEAIRNVCIVIKTLLVKVLPGHPNAGGVDSVIALYAQHQHVCVCVCVRSHVLSSHPSLGGNNVHHCCFFVCF